MALSKMNNLTVDEIYPLNTLDAAVVEKDWAAGSRKPMDSTEILISFKGTGKPAGGSTGKPTVRKIATMADFSAVITKATFAPALLKIADEPMVNILDHVVRCLLTKEKVKNIRVTFDQSGRITIWNDGPGVDVEIHQGATAKYGKPTYVPTFIFSEMLQGSNKKKSSDSISGGTNGIGVKLTVLFSLDCTVETIDAVRKRHFTQRWENGKKIIHPAIVTDSAKAPYTSISFIPDYKEFGFDYPLSPAQHQLIHDLLMTRTIFAAVYARYLDPNISVSMNDIQIPHKSMSDIAKLCFPNNQILDTVMKTPAKLNPDQKYPWYVSVVIGAGKQSMSEISNINGVMVRSGQHTKFIKKLIVDAAAVHMKKTLSDKSVTYDKKFVTGNVFIFVNCAIPDVSWTGQRKDVMNIPSAKLEEYTLPAVFVNQFKEIISETILTKMFTQQATQRITLVNKQTVNYEKYWPATYAGTRRSKECALLYLEGDSAVSQAKIGCSGQRDFFGMISTGGVPVNCRKESVEIITPAGTMLKTSDKMDDNKFITAMIAALGLNRKHTYDPNGDLKKYKKEMSELNYGRFIGIPDQDHDGKGNIMASILNTFERFWPNLFDSNFLQWFCTAIVRAFPLGKPKKNEKRKVMHFYNLIKFEEWRAQNDMTNWDIKYYKGLGTHSKDQIAFMFKAFNDQLYTFTLDSRSHEMFEIYFGNDSNKRKVKLAQPPAQYQIADIKKFHDEKRLPCSYHLEESTDEYQRDNLNRKLGHGVDGQNDSSRKILKSSMEYFPNGTKQVRVSQLAGFVSENSCYHHGESSLMDSIQGAAFLAVGGKQLPFLVPYSNFGTRLQGGQDAASPRYAECRLNIRLTQLLFPRVDYPNLKFTIDDNGKPAPDYFVPIICLAAAESTCVPAHGWLFETWGRDIASLIKNTKRQIRLGVDCTLLPFEPARNKGSPYEWKGRFGSIRGEPYSFGAYSIVELESADMGALIRITELPLREWTTPYVNNLKKKITGDGKLIESILDHSDDIIVNIQVRLVPGGYKAILDRGGDLSFTDAFEEYFLLRQRMNLHLNLMGMDNAVHEYKSYAEVQRYWFQVRKEFYIKRVERELILFNLWIDIYKSIIRYVDECESGLVLSKMTEHAMNKLLESLGYVKYYKIGLEKHRKYKTAELIEKITSVSSKATYDYLLNLTDRAKSAESQASYRAKLEEYEAQRDSYINKSQQGSFPGSVLWEEELDQLSAIVEEGMATDWKFGEAQAFEL